MPLFHTPAPLFSRTVGRGSEGFQGCTVEELPVAAANNAQENLSMRLI